MLMQIDGTFVFVVISFLIFLFIIKSVLFNPISTIIEKREEFFEKNSQIEQKSKDKTKALLEQKESELKEAKKQATDILKQAKNETNKQSKEIIKQTKKDIEDSINSLELELTKEKNLAKAQIKQELSSIVQSIIYKVLNENIELSLDDNTINEYLKI